MIYKRGGVEETPNGERAFAYSQLPPLLPGVAQECAEQLRVRVLRQFDLQKIHGVAADDESRRASVSF